MSAEEGFHRDVPGDWNHLVRYARELEEENKRLEENLAVEGELLALYR